MCEEIVLHYITTKFVYKLLITNSNWTITNLLLGNVKRRMQKEIG